MYMVANPTDSISLLFNELLRYWVVYWVVGTNLKTKLNQTCTAGCLWTFLFYNLCEPTL